ncbi:MAG: nucleoside diphosphate kinase regulator [Acidobacteria bacterium]|nr:MAG: nucleoside diphosphate kinase regulator [Acidobacteriota bacterium]
MRKKKQTSTICITETDKNRLSSLIETTRERDGVEDREYLDKLEHELERATIVEANAIPADVITMGSKVRLRDLVSGEANIYSLVFPRDADFNQGKISVLAPIGTAILGYRKGDTIEWQVPSGLRRLKVDDVIYQPEAAGHFDP